MSRNVPNEHPFCGADYVTGPAHDPYGTACDRPPGHAGPHIGDDPFGGDGVVTWSGGVRVAGDRTPYRDVRHVDERAEIDAIKALLEPVSSAVSEYVEAVQVAIEVRADANVMPYLRTHCRECYCTPEPEDGEHVMIGAWVVVGCEGYWVVDPNVVGIRSPGWQRVAACESCGYDHDDPERHCTNTGACVPECACDEHAE